MEACRVDDLQQIFPIRIDWRCRLALLGKCDDQPCRIMRRCFVNTHGTEWVWQCPRGMPDPNLVRIDRRNKLLSRHCGRYEVDPQDSGALHLNKVDTNQRWVRADGGAAQIPVALIDAEWYLHVCVLVCNC